MNHLWDLLKGKRQQGLKDWLKSYYFCLGFWIIWEKLSFKELISWDLSYLGIAAFLSLQLKSLWQKKD